MSFALGRTSPSVNTPGIRPRQAVALFAASRVAIWGVGMVAALTVAHRFHFGLGSTGDVLAAPVLADDGGWFTHIALHGYSSTDGSAAFLPLYPLLLRIVGAGGLVAVTIVGVAVSTAAFAAALVLLHRLVRLDFGEPVATRTVVLVAVFPTAVFFSAVYSESLFLLLSIGAFYAARLRVVLNVAICPD